MISGDTQYLIKLKISKNKLLRFTAGQTFLILSFSFYIINKSYWLIYYLGRYEKLYDDDIFSNRGNPLYQLLKNQRRRLLDESMTSESNPVLESFKKTNYAKKVKDLYKKYGVENSVRLRYVNEDHPGREGNLLILKKPRIEGSRVVEKGVLYIQYNNSIKEFSALFNLNKVMKEFSLVVEPSSWGYRDLSLELLLCGKNHLYVMAQDEIDFKLSRTLDSRIIPIRAGAGDWIDVDNVRSPNYKKVNAFDICMVASWRKLKNHKLMFQSLAKIRDGLRIALVGYAWGGRTVESIRREQEKYYPRSVVSIFENVPHEYVFKVLSDSKVALMLSKREGANRGIYEALSSNIPVVMLEDNRGVNKSLVEMECVHLSSEMNLTEKIKELLNNKEKSAVADRLRSVSGTQNTWDLIRETLLDHEKIRLPSKSIIVSRPNLKYRNLETKCEMDGAYYKMQHLLEAS